jgi:hypothetical protein
MTVGRDEEDGPSSPGKPRRREPLILALVGLAGALLLFVSAALPVLTDRAPESASGMTTVASTTTRSVAATSPQLQPASPPPPPSSVVVTVPPPTTAPPPPTTPAPASTAPPDHVATSTVAPSRRSTGRDVAGATSLAVGPIDEGAFPRVVFDVVVPEPLAAVRLRPKMVDVDGGRVESVTAVDPRDIAVAMIIDDSPSIDAAVLGHLQGASVELVRHLGRGTEVALATPSGLASAFTPSRDANIGRIAGITAGSPAATPLPGLLISSIRELASNPAPDRHAVLLLDEALAVTTEQIEALERAVAVSGIRLHLVVPPGVDATAIASVAVASGGVVTSSPNVVASIDDVTAAIARRYRVVATVASRGPHAIALTAKDLHYEVTAAPV